nr:putative manganese-dependent inorganic diphosphatase [uncultured Agathobaculum sp.]
MNPVFVIGHRTPDTDSICSAICYAWLKQTLTGREHIACRAGQINAETKYVLDYFDVEAPRYLASLHPRLRDVQYRRVKGIDAQLSLRRAWQYMSEANIHTIPVVDSEGNLEGLLTLSDIARFYMEDQDANALAASHTSYRNLVDVLNGELVVGNLDGHFEQGKVVVAAANPDVMEGYIGEHDLVIMGNRYESQLCSIEMNAGCIVIGLGAPVSRTIKKLAEERGCSVISTPMDTYTCSKVINQAVPVQHIMKRSGLITFRPDDLVEDVKKTVAKKRIRYYPILDDNGKYIGMVSQRNLLDIEKQEVILVDHNERDQAVDGIQAAQVTEIIDHHRIGALETAGPIYFRNQPLGCTATIVAQLYRENGVEISRQAAGLLCSAILSDTLMFRSPTCTPIDRRIAEEMAQIAGVDIQSHAVTMFREGSQLVNRSMDEIFHMDYKYYQVRGRRITVSQITSVNQEELDAIRTPMLDYMRSCLPSSGLVMLFAMLTNIIDETTELIYVGNGAASLVHAAFQTDNGSDSVVLPGVVSRKKQLILPLLAALEQGETDEL